MANPYRGRVTQSVYKGGLADPKMVRRAFELFTNEEQTVHLTAAPSWRQILLMASPDELAKAAESLSDSHGVYFGLNPVALAPWAKDKVKDEHIVERKWLFVDADPVRPAPAMNSTDHEHEAARLVVMEIMDVLGREAGFPHPIVADSGNGWHLFWPIELPNDDDTRRIIRDVLRSLAARFDTDKVKVDKSCHDARRVAKLPGTWVRKGPHSQDRPHRPSKLVYIPESLEVVGRELLEIVAATAPQKGRPPKAKGQAVYYGRVSTNHDRSYALAALQREAVRCASAGCGDLNNQLFKSGAACGNFIPKLLSSQEVFDTLLGAIKQAGANNENKDQSTLRRAIEKGMETPRQVPERESVHPSGQIPSVKGQLVKQDSSQAPLPEVVTIQASDIETRSVEWLWPGRIPVGKLTTIAGMPGLGKTFFLCDLVARVTSCSPWPDGKANSDKGSVLFISGEDEPEDTLVPRMQEAGADLTRVRFFRADAFSQFSLRNIELLDRAVAEADNDVRLVAIDPPTSFTLGTDDHKNSELRSILTPLATWAANNRCAVVFVTHLNKGGAAKVEAAVRVVGSIAWVAATRAAYLMNKDPHDDSRRIFAVIKNNLAPEPPTLGYRLVHTEDNRGRLEWLGVVDCTADQAVNGSGHAGEQRNSERFLIDMFRTKQEWESDELFKEAKEEGISRRTIYRTKEKLNMPKPRKCVRQNGDTYWVWWVPPEWEHLREAEREQEF